MHNPLAIAILSGLGGMFGWGSADFFAKITIDKAGPIKCLVWAHIFGTSLLIMAAIVQVIFLGHNLDLPHGSAWLGLLFFGMLQMVVYYLAYKGFEKGQLAVLNPVFASFTGIVALVSILFLGEAVHAGLVVGLALLFIGIITLNLDPEGLKNKRLNFVPGLKEVGAATLLAALWTLGWDKLVSGHDALTYALFMYFFMTLAAIVLALAVKEEISGDIPTTLWRLLLLMGLGEAVAYLSISWGYSSTNLTSIVALISGAFSVPTIILAYVFLKERITKIQTAAIAMIIASICIVSLG